MKGIKKDLTGCHKQGTLADLGLPVKKVCQHPDCPFKGIEQDIENFYADYNKPNAEVRPICKVCWKRDSDKNRKNRKLKEKNEKEFLDE